MASACKIFGHRWRGRICKRCGAIRSVSHAHHFVSMKDECAEECTICGEQRLTAHDWQCHLTANRTMAGSWWCLVKKIFAENAVLNNTRE